MYKYFLTIKYNRMASNIENDYDSDTELVPDFDMVDLNDFKLIKGDELAGGSWELPVEHLRDESISLQFALPAFKINDAIDIETASKNGFFRVKLDEGNKKHEQFKNFITTLETWLVSQIINNHNDWFGYMWKSGGPLEGFSPPPSSAIKEMYHPMIDEDNIFCSRVHIRKGNYQIQCMDTEQNMISLDSIKNCNVVPLVEVKGVFMKPRSYNPDIVLRGLVTIPSAKKNVESPADFCLFHTEDKSDSYAYYDYATEDEDTDCEDNIISTKPAETKDIEIPVEKINDKESVPVAVAPEEITPEGMKENNTETNTDETLQSLMRASEDAKLAAKNAEDVYQKYVSQNAAQS
jgi:hypothetical protein